MKLAMNPLCEMCGGEHLSIDCSLLASIRLVSDFGIALHAEMCGGKDGCSNEIYKQEHLCYTVVVERIL